MLHARWVTHLPCIMMPCRSALHCATPGGPGSTRRPSPPMLCPSCSARTEIAYGSTNTRALCHALHSVTRDTVPA
eukprot:3938029-Rhodomonas_salina.4